MQNELQICQSQLLLWQVKWGISSLWTSEFLYFYIFILNSDQTIVKCRRKCSYQLYRHGNIIYDDTMDYFLFSFVSVFSRSQTTKAFLPRMLELQHGHVVCINSILSQSPIPGAIDYCTSKASSLAFMESLTLGLLDCPGVSCTTVLPFHTNTEMFQGMRVRSVSTCNRKRAMTWEKKNLLHLKSTTSFYRFPQLFPPLKPEVVAERTVDAVRTDKAFLYLPWTMHALVFLKR